MKDGNQSMEDALLQSFQHQHVKTSTAATETHLARKQTRYKKRDRLHITHATEDCGAAAQEAVREGANAAFV